MGDLYAAQVVCVGFLSSTGEGASSGVTAVKLIFPGRQGASVTGLTKKQWEKIQIEENKYLERNHAWLPL
jgi:hypothetical protein